jgi:hypothetical protein
MELELAEIVHQAENGDASCSSVKCVLVADPEKDPGWDGTESFDSGDDEEDNDVVCEPFYH